MGEEVTTQPDEEPFGDDEDDYPLIPDSVWQAAVGREDYYRPLGLEGTPLWESMDEEARSRLQGFISESRFDTQGYVERITEAAITDHITPPTFSVHTATSRTIEQLAEESGTPPRFLIPSEYQPRTAEEIYQAAENARENAQRYQLNRWVHATEGQEPSPENLERYRRVYYHHPRMSGRAAAAQRLARDARRYGLSRLENVDVESMNEYGGVQRDERRDEITIPMEALEQVDIDQINAIVENRRVHSAFGAVLQELGLGGESGDQDFKATMAKAVLAIRKIKEEFRALKAHTESLALTLRRMNESLEQTPQDRVDMRAEHGHDTQWRILSMDDEVLETSEWIEGGDAWEAKEALREHLSDWQLQGKDVYLAEYHRCRWVNVTTKKDREN